MFDFFREDSDEKVHSVIVFSDEHIWCCKKHKGKWFNLDSLCSSPEQIDFRDVFARRGFGWIIISKNNQSHQKSSQSNSNVKQKQYQISNSRLELCLKEDSFEEEEDQSNRFQILENLQE